MFKVGGEVVKGRDTIALQKRKNGEEDVKYRGKKNLFGFPTNLGGSGKRKCLAYNRTNEMKRIRKLSSPKPGSQLKKGGAYRERKKKKKPT